jgi:hypothetical protein
MRLTTSTAARLSIAGTAAGLAALVTGCSSSGTASGPVVVHHQVKAAPAAAAKPAAPLNAKQLLAKAVRTSLAAHAAQFRYRDTKTLVDPTKGESVNPYYSSAGVANFDRNLVTVYTVAGDHANQPYLPSLAKIIEQDNVFVGDPSTVVGSGTWSKSAATPGNAADVQITQVMQDVKGPVKIVRKTSNTTIFELQSDMSKMLVDQSGNSSDPIAKELAGTTQTEHVWVNREGLITQARWTIDPGKVHVSGLNPSVVKAAYITINYSNYGVDVFVPPHPTA